MAKRTNKAGQNIRRLAGRRREKAILSFAAAGMAIAGPFVIFSQLETFINDAFSTSTPQAQTDPFRIPPAVYGVGLLAAMGLTAKGAYLWKRANHADQGAKGEEDIAQALTTLTAAGWQIEYGLRLGKGLGDADAVCVSPQGKVYVIDVKSHRGRVGFDGKVLYRQFGATKKSFEKDFLQASMRQAVQVKQQKQVSFVTPIVAFSDAFLTTPKGKLRGVYVVKRDRLVPLLKQLG